VRPDRPASEANPLARIESVLTVAGVAYFLIQLHLRSAGTMPDVGEAESIQFYRAGLERQRDFRRGTWLWPGAVMFLPGPIVFMAGFARAYPIVAPFSCFPALVFLLALVVGVPLNLRLARQFQPKDRRLGRMAERPIVTQDDTAGLQTEADAIGRCRSCLLLQSW
jgi:hypothetical protein